MSVKTDIQGYDADEEIIKVARKNASDAGVDKLIHFHIHDGSEIPPKNHLALGDGEIHLPDRLKLAQSRNARCVLETKTIEALKQSVRWLQENNWWEGFPK